MFPRFSLMNVRSLLPKIDELSARISFQPTNVIAITESWLSEVTYDNLLSIEGFNIYRKDRAFGRGGGDIPSKRRLDLENATFECLWIWLRPAAPFLALCQA